MIPYSFNPMGIDAVQELSDLDILRQIRDANPTSELPSLWLDTEDPYTQWEGVTWNDEKIRVTQLDVNSKSITSLPNINKLTSLQLLYCMSNQLTTLDVSGLASLQQLYCSYNQLTTITTLTSKGLITSYDFRFNNMPILETDRIIALGFSSTYVLPQNP